MKTKTKMARAVDYADAVQIAEDQWAHYDHSSAAWWVVSAADLESLADFLDNSDPTIAGDAYSFWCAETDAVEQPEGWEPPWE